MVGDIKKVLVVGDMLDASHGLLTACVCAALAACFPAHTLHAVYRIVTSHTKHHMLYSTCLILGKLHEATPRPCPRLL